LVEVSVSVTACPAYGCCCSGKPSTAPVGQVKLAVGTAVCVHAETTVTCCVVVLEPLQLVAVSVTV
jgi:hypothetical protein